MYKSPDKKYLEQWERVKRWHQKVKELDNAEVDLEDNYCLDIVYAFFINCFHLRDWIKNSVPSLENDVMDLFKKSTAPECFKLCADICNGSKHLELNHPKIDKDTKIISQSVTVFVGTVTTNRTENENNKTKARYSWSIGANDQKFDVYELAQDCVDEWDKFLKGKTLV